MNLNLHKLNKEFKDLPPGKRIERVFQLGIDPNQIIITSSFGINSERLLSTIYKLSIPKPFPRVVFIDTQYLFKETYQYKELLRKKYDLPITYIYPDIIAHEMAESAQMWKNPKSTKNCCFINKVHPLRRFLFLNGKKIKMWISGITEDTLTRKNTDILHVHDFSPVTTSKLQVIKFNPFLKSSYNSNSKHQLPNSHPLQVKGYESVGCTHCTIAGKDRSGRWSGSGSGSGSSASKECGLHLLPSI